MGLTDNRFDTGTVVSGAGHGVLLLWLVIGGWFSATEPLPPVGVATVTTMSSAEFDALMNPSDSETEAPAVETAAAEPPTQPEPEVTEPLPAAEPEVQPEVVPEPEPQPEPPAEVPPVSDTPPEPPRENTEILPDAAEDPGATDAPLPQERPQARPEDRVSDTTTERVEDVAEAEVATERPSDVPSEEPPVEEPPEEAAPEPTTEVVVNADSAPTSSPVPRSRPAATTPPPAEEVPEAETNPEAEPVPEETEVAANDAVNDALAEALAAETAAAEETAEQPVAAANSGPPMTSGEMDGMRVAVSRCWNVGSLSTDALRTKVVVLVAMNADGTPGGISLQGFDGGTEASATQAFESARRAIIRCGASGFPLPAEKYEQWREIEMTFDPSEMRIR